MLNELPGFKYYRAPEGDPAPAPDPTPSPDPAPEPSGDFTVPETYKERGWAKNLKNNDDVWKMLDNAQVLAGKKAVIPDLEKGDPKEIEEYISQLRPKDKAVYQFDEDVQEDARGAYADMLFDAGIPAVQANKLIKTFMSSQKAQLAKDFDNDAFSADMKKTYGDDYKAKLSKTADALKEMVSPEDFKFMDVEAPNAFSAALYKIATKMREDYEGKVAELTKKYGAVELGAGGAEPGGNGSVDKTSERTRIRKDMDALSKRPHTAAEKAALQRQLDATYQQ